MATKRNPLSIKYDKIAAQIRRDIRDMYEYNYSSPITHGHIKGLMDLVNIQFGEQKKILKAYEAENTKELFIKAGAKLAAGPKKKILDKTKVNLKYRGFNIITYKGQGNIWIAEATNTDGTTFIVYSKPNEMKTAVEIVQEKIRKYLKK